MRTDSIASELEIYAGAVADAIEPPEDCGFPEAALPYWYSIVNGKTRRAWTAHDLQMAVDLAWSKYRTIRLIGELENEEDTIVQPSGTPNRS